MSDICVNVGTKLSLTVMVTVSLHVNPLLVTSTQYSVVSVGTTEMTSAVSPVDQI